jgi:hypothetical protein
MGGLTFLFLSFFFLFSLWPLVLEGSNARGLGRLSQTVSDLPNLEMKNMWPAVAGAIVGTVMIDAPIRLFLWWRLSRNLLRREVIMGSLHYAIFVPVLVGLGGATVALRMVLIEGFLPFDLIMPVLLSALAGIGLLTGWLVRPAAALLGKALGRGGSARVERRHRRICAVALTGLLAAAIYAGAVAALIIGNEKEGQAKAQRHLRVLAIRCDIQSGTLTVSAVVWNQSQEPKVLEPRDDISVTIGQFRKEADFDAPVFGRLYEMTWLEPKDEFQIVGPGGTLRLKGTSQAGLPGKEDRCGLTRGMNSGESIVGKTWPIGERIRLRRLSNSDP